MSAEESAKQMKPKRRLSQKLSRIAGPLAVVVVAAAVGLFTFWPDISQKWDKAVYKTTTLAESCPAGSAEQSECQKKYYQGLYEREGADESFVQLRADYEKDNSVQLNCHQLTHVVGRAAALKYNDVAGAYAEGDEFCWSGYYHGVMEGLLKKLSDQNMKVADSLNTICESVKKQGMYSFDHYNCAHGLGHGIMLIQATELFESLKTCDKIVDSWERESCYSGVFMENVMAHINPDHTTKYLRDDDPLYPCNAVEQQYAHACYMMQTSHSLAVYKNDYNKVFEMCNTQVGEANRPTCYQSLGRDASGNSVSNPEITKNICVGGPTYEAQENCVIGAVKDFVSYYKDDQESAKLCNLLNDQLKQTCTTTAATYYQSL